MKVWEMPWFERPGVRLKRGGPEVLSDAELLAVVLGRGSKTENVIDCSRRVLKHHNLDLPAGLSVSELAKIFSGDEVFGEKMKRLTRELRKQMEEGMKLDEGITKNLGALGYGC